MKKTWKRQKDRDNQYCAPDQKETIHRTRHEIRWIEIKFIINTQNRELWESMIATACRHGTFLDRMLLQKPMLEIYSTVFKNIFLYLQSWRFCCTKSVFEWKLPKICHFMELTRFGNLMIHDGGTMMLAWIPRVHCSSICCIIKHVVLLWYADLHHEQLIAIISWSRM